MLNLNNLRHKSTLSAFHDGFDRALGGLFLSHYNPRISVFGIVGGKSTSFSRNTLKVKNLVKQLPNKHFFIFCLLLQAASTLAVAQEKALPEAIQKAGIVEAMSRNMPPSVKDLPVFGSIDWTVKELPFVGKGPRQGISGMGMVAAQGRIYLIGGFIPGGDGTHDLAHRTSRWAFQYSPGSDRWEKLPDLPARREYTRAIATDHEIYVLGGAVQGRPAVPSADVFRLSLSSSSPAWQKAGELTVPRSHTAVGKVGRYLVVAGGNRYDIKEKGYSPKTIQGVTDVFDLTKPTQGWRQGAPIPGSPRGWTAASALEGRLLVFGGTTFKESDGGVGAKIREALSYDPVMDKWTSLAEPPVAVSGWQSAVYNHRYVIVVGGVSSLWNDVPFVYDAVADRWMRIDSPLPPGGLFNDPGVCIIGDTIYVTGSEGPEGSHFNYFLAGRIRAKSKAN